MNLSDTIQLLMLIASTVAIIVSAVMSREAILASMKMVREQNHIQMFAEYTKRYQDIIMNMPKCVYEDEVCYNDDIARFMQLYFNLCSEEYDLMIKDAISDDVWSKWLTGMKATMQHQAYRLAWSKQRENYALDFRGFFDKVKKGELG